MFPEVLPENGKNILDILSRTNILDNFYLAGGTGLALQVGHRKSVDLDFFSDQNFNTMQYINQLNTTGEFKLLDEALGTITGIFNNVKISFFSYNYPLIWDLKSFNRIKIADIKEIGLIKFTAIAGRGTKKDFIDLYWIGNNVISLAELFSFFDQKYGNTYSLYHTLKSLIYFKDAEDDKMPEMLKQVKWQDIKNYFYEEEKKLFNLFYK
jgi:hypothetical protein